MNDFVQFFSDSDASNVATSVKMMLLLTVLSLAPAILILMTSFARIIIVLSFVRTALATQQMPPNQVLVGLALFLTFSRLTIFSGLFISPVSKSSSISSISSGSSAGFRDII